MQSEENPNISIDTDTDPRQWVAKHSDYLYKYALTRINDTETARELVQDTLLAALEKIEKFERKSSERTWLTAILKNKVVDVYRKRSSTFIKQPDLAASEQEMEDFFEPDACNWKPDHRPQEFGIEQPDCLEQKEFQQILQRCMKKLPGLWLSVFTMKHLDDETTDTICGDLKITPSNFWVIIHRTKLNLRECLQKHWV